MCISKYTDRCAYSFAYRCAFTNTQPGVHSIHLCIREYTARCAFNFVFICAYAENTAGCTFNLVFICAFAKTQLGLHSAVIFDSIYRVTIDNVMEDDVMTSHMTP